MTDANAKNGGSESFPDNRCQVHAEGRIFAHGRWPWFLFLSSREIGEGEASSRLGRTPTFLRGAKSGSKPPHSKMGQGLVTSAAVVIGAPPRLEPRWTPTNCRG